MIRAPNFLNNNDCSCLSVLNQSNVRHALNVGHINAQSIYPLKRVDKFTELKDLISTSNLNIIGISETWLKEHHTDTMLNIPGYRLFRNDRIGLRGGGVALYICDQFRCKVIYTSSGIDVEYIFVQVSFGSEVCLVGVVYRSSGDLTILEGVLNNISVNYSNIIIVGDFNLNLFMDPIRERVLSFFEQYGLLVRTNDAETHYDVHHGSTSLLDFFVISCPGKVLLSNQFWISNISKHALVFIAFDLRVDLVESVYVYRNFRSLNIEALYRDASLIDLSFLYRTNDVNVQVNKLIPILLSLFDQHVPLKTAIQRNSYHSWYTIDVIRAKTLRDLAFNAYREDRTHENWKIYTKCRNRVTNLIKKQKCQLGLSEFSNIRNSKDFWKKARNFGVVNNNKNNSTCNWSADEFNEHFVQPTANMSERFNFEHVNENGFLFRSISNDDFLTALFSIKTNSVGLDNLSLKFIKILLPVFGNAFVHIINTAIMTSTFPEAWKRAKVIPIPKAGSSPSMLSNFRPISILPILSKVFEINLKNQVTQFLNENDLLYRFQSGFRRHHSTTSAMIAITDDIRFNIDKKCATILVLLDFTKAFDTIDHNILCSKLASNFHFARTSCKLIWSYLRGRQQQVFLESSISSFLTLGQGVPQGSVLGPLLFSLFINDLPSTVSHSKIHLYADDAQVIHFAPLDDIERSICKVNDDLNNLSLWASSNNLKLNPLKSKAIVIYRNSISSNLGSLYLNGVLIPYSRSVVSLGFKIDETLSWEAHINGISSKTYLTLRTLYLVKQYLPVNVRAKLVRSLIMPFFTYGCELFSGCSIGVRNKLRIVFNSCIRFIYSLKRYNHISAFHLSFLGCSFNKFLNIRNLIFLFKVFHSREPSYIFSKFQFLSSSRRRGLLIPIHTSAISDLSFSVRSSRLWNALGTNVRRFESMSLSQFKYILTQSNYINT